MIFTTVPPTTRPQIIYMLIIIILFFFTLIGALGWVLEKYIEKRGKRVDADMWKLVETRVVTSPQQFKKIAMKKNYRLAFLEFFWPYVLTGLIIAVFFAFQTWIDTSYTFADLFDYTDRGFNTLFPIIDWENIPRSEFFGLLIPSDFPSLLNSPRFVPDAIISYVIFMMAVIALLLFSRAVIGLFARSIKISYEATNTFTKSLSDVAKRL
jgi:hypothetical protein